MQKFGDGQQRWLNQLFSRALSPFFFVFLTSFAHASLYSDKIKNISPESISNLFPHHDPDVICLSTAENPFLIGMIHQVPIHSNIDNVISVFEAFEAYPKIFKDLKRVNLIVKKGSKDFLVEFESIIPIPFVPNSIYQMQYKSKIDEKPQFQKIYTYNLKSGNLLKSLDGIAIIKKLSPTETLYQEVDFIDADWGIAKTFARKSIWIDTVTGSYESDFGLKLKSESPTMQTKEILKQSRFSVEAKKIQECLEHKKDAGFLFSNSAK